MNRWINRVAVAVLALGGLAGCKQQLYLTHDDARAVSLKIPANLDTDSNVAAPPTDFHPKPVIITDPDREKRYMTLQEAFAIALEGGTRGTQAVNSLSNILGGPTGLIGTGRIPYVDDTSTISFFGGVLNNPDDSIRAFALDPATIGTNIEHALAKFDTRWSSSMTWTKTDNATASTLTNLTNGDAAAFSSGFYKPMPTGGLTGITFNTNYLKYSAPPSTFGVVNPAYTPSLQFTFEQPLLKGYGIDINQLTPSASREHHDSQLSGHRWCERRYSYYPRPLRSGSSGLRVQCEPHAVQCRNRLLDSLRAIFCSVCSGSRCPTIVHDLAVDQDEI